METCSLPVCIPKVLSMGKFIHQSRRVQIAKLLPSTTVGRSVRAKLAEALAKPCAMAVCIVADSTARRYRSKPRCRLAVQCQCVAHRWGRLTLLRSFNANTLIYEHLTTRNDHKYKAYPRAVCISLHLTIYFPTVSIPILLFSSTSISYARHHDFHISCASRRSNIRSFPIQPFTWRGIRISYHVRYLGCSTPCPDGTVPKLVLHSFYSWVYR